MLPMTWWCTVWSGALARSRVNEGFPREGGVRKSLHEGQVGCLLVRSDKERDYCGSLIEDIRFMSD